MAVEGRRADEIPANPEIKPEDDIQLEIAKKLLHWLLNWIFEWDRISQKIP